MSLTAKQIMDAALGESGFPTLDQYFGGNDPTITALLNRCARNFSQYEYSGLRTEGTLTLTTALTYEMPSDLRYIVADSMQAQDQERFVKFPTSTAEWWYLKARTTSSGIRYKARFSNGLLHFEDPQSGSVILYEYLSSNVVLSDGAGSADKERFTADTDTWLLDDDLLILDLKWRYKVEKGIEGWQLDKQNFLDYEQKHKGLEAGSGSLYMGSSTYNEFPEPYYNLWQ